MGASKSATRKPRTLGERVRYHRIQLTLTQSQLAKRIGVQGLAISEIELGKTSMPQLSTLQALAVEFSVTVSYLVGAAL